MELVVLYGAPTNMLEYEQMAGRGGRDGHTKCLVLLLAEPWLYSESSSVKNSNGTFNSKAVKTDEEVFNYVRTRLCRRAHQANINNDISDNGKRSLYYYFIGQSK